MISFLAIFTNAGLIVFTSEIITTNQAEVFTILLIAFLAVKYLIRFLIPDEPAEALILNKRHEFVVEKAVKVFIILNSGFLKRRQLTLPYGKSQ
jgi:anoctamin-10